MASRFARPIFVATLIAGTLDILAAVGLTLFYGREPTNMLRYVASGPFPEATGWGGGGALLGLAVHFALMAAMAAFYVAAAGPFTALRDKPILGGTGYGLVTYAAMNLIVVPMRWPEAFPPSLVSVGTQLFCHVVLVGIPIALAAAYYLRGRKAYAE